MNVMSINSRQWLCMGLLLVLLAALNPVYAASVGTGLFGGAPSLKGPLKRGELDELKKELGAALNEAKPLHLNLSSDSDPQEILRLALWLREQQPVGLEIAGNCTDACAWFLLSSGRPLRVAGDALIAFGGSTESIARLHDQLKAGDLFTDHPSSQAARARLMQRMTGNFEQAAALREARRLHVQAPAWVRDFALNLTSAPRVDRVDMSGDGIGINFDFDKHYCAWWIPDAEGMRQLGLDVPGYQAPDRAQAAKRLNAHPAEIYIGPAVQTRPEQPLCP